MSENHPDFLAADESHRWKKPLAELLPHLSEQAWKAKGGWAYVILPAGACVALRIIESGPAAFHKMLRISRHGIKRPNPDLWLAEVRTFQAYLDVREWGDPDMQVDQETDTDRYRAVALLIEPEGLPAKNRCSRCGKPTPHEPEYKEDVCNACALELGQNEAAARRGMTPPYPGGGEIEPAGGEPT